MDEKILKELKAWVIKYYSPTIYNWTSERSQGNYDDCFDDGFDCGQSVSAYSIGKILGMDLEEPRDTENDDEEDE